MKIKIIDLFNMISKGEKLPKKVMSRGVDWELGDGTNHYFYLDDCGNNKFTKDDLFEELYELHGLRFLNDEVEIEEEKEIPEKLDYCEENTFMEQKETTYLSPKERRLLDSNFKEIGNKINSIIDYLQSKGE